MTHCEFLMTLAWIAQRCNASAQKTCCPSGCAEIGLGFVAQSAVDVHISALRKKLGDDPKTPQFIRTVRSAGYMWIDPDDA